MYIYVLASPNELDLRSKYIKLNKTQKERHFHNATSKCSALFIKRCSKMNTNSEKLEIQKLSKEKEESRETAIIGSF